jgi:cardiolipin synthase
MWMLAVVVVRDVIILAGAEAYRRLTGRLDVRPTWSGKIATFLEFVLVSWVLADIALDLGLDALIEPLTLLTALAVSGSGLRYVWLWTRKTSAFLREQARQ